MTLGGNWPPLSKVEIADFGGASFVLRDVFFTSFFLAYVEPNLFFAFGRENSPVQPLALAGMGGTCTDTNLNSMGSCIKVLDGGYFERFIVLKRIVVAEIELIEDYAVEREALATGVCFCLCPMIE